MASLSLGAGIRGNATYLFELECVRGLAIALVFLFHVHGILGYGVGGSTGLLESFIVSGATGVTLFFVLSGFLLTLPWVEYATGVRAERPNIPNYYIARVLRIVPLYYLAVLVAAIVTGQWDIAARAALFQFVGFEMPPFSAVWWTLTTEVQFYLLLPLAALAILRGGWARYLFFALLLAWAAAYLWLFVIAPQASHLHSYWYTKSLFGRLPAFAIGFACVLVYLRLKSRTAAPTPSARLLALLAVVAVLLALGLVLQQVSVMNDWVAEWRWHAHHTYEGFLWGALTLLLLLTSPFGKGILVNRPMALLGKLSYSIYIVHVPVLAYLIQPKQAELGAEALLSSHWAWTLPAVAAVLTVVLSWALYRYFEMPFLDLKTRLPVYRQGAERAAKST